MTSLGAPAPTEPTRLSRRGVVRTLAWSLPAVQLVAAAPAYADSTARTSPLDTPTDDAVAARGVDEIQPIDAVWRGHRLEATLQIPLPTLEEVGGIEQLRVMVKFPHSYFGSTRDGSEELDIVEHTEAWAMVEAYDGDRDHRAGIVTFVAPSPMPVTDVVVLTFTHLQRAGQRRSLEPIPVVVSSSNAGEFATTLTPSIRLTSADGELLTAAGDPTPGRAGVPTTGRTRDQRSALDRAAPQPPRPWSHWRR